MVAGNTGTFHESEQSKNEGMTRTIALVAKKPAKENKKKTITPFERKRGRADGSKLRQVVGGN